MRGMKLQDVIESLNEIAPPELAEAWDNTGLLLRPLQSRPVRRILLTIDLTEAVASEAIAARSDLIISYHPILFHPIRRLDADLAADRTLMKLVQKNIAVFSPHTALDAVVGGVNDWLAEGVGAGTVSVLQPSAVADAGQGRLVELHRSVRLTTLARRLKAYLGIGTLRTAEAAGNRPIKTVALCAGAGADILEGVEADCYLTGEMSHHRMLEFTLNGTHVLLCEHSNSERGYLPVFRTVLSKALGAGVDIVVSEMDADPVNFQ